jgi:ATP-dependent DNA ligase
MVRARRHSHQTFTALPKTRVRFIEPMYARLVSNLPEGDEWLYEVKFDGYRCLAGRAAAGVRLWSRRGNLFTEQFPISPSPARDFRERRLWTVR